MLLMLRPGEWGPGIWGRGRTQVWPGFTPPQRQTSAARQFSGLDLICFHKIISDFLFSQNNFRFYTLLHITKNFHRPFMPVDFRVVLFCLICVCVFPGPFE